MIGEFIIVGVTVSAVNNLIEETGIMKNIVENGKVVVGKTVHQGKVAVMKGKVIVTESVPAVMTMGFAGIADDNAAKVLTGVGAVGLIVAASASSPVVVKIAIGASIGCFMSGFIRGARHAWNEVRTQEEV